MAVLTIRGVKSYGTDRDVRIDLSSRVTLIYGQNGSGKSTISNFFTGYYPDKYAKCRFESADELSSLVFNQDYIERKFSLEKVQPGIFTLSETNQELQERIETNTSRLTAIAGALTTLDEQIKDREKMEQKITDDCASRMFKRTAGERSVFSDFLTGAKYQKNFFERIKGINSAETAFNMADLEERLNLLERSKGTSNSQLALPLEPGSSPDVTRLLEAPLQTASGTQFSEFIARLGNADWIRSGHQFVTDDRCPFCQQSFDAVHFASELAGMYDRTYELDLEALSDAHEGLKKDIEKLTAFQESLFRHPAIPEDSSVFSILRSLILLWETNLQRIAGKMDRPSCAFTLEETETAWALLAQETEAINAQIAEGNRLAINYDTERSKLRDDIYTCLRYICDEYLQAYQNELQEVSSQRRKYEQDVAALLKEKVQLGREICQLAERLSVIQPTIDEINKNLVALGITDFSICCHDEQLKLYRLQRNSDPHDADIFHTLSEGEKTLIALLYFLESCTGSITTEAASYGGKLVVIDDPISSLSHNYIYEVASLIKRKLIQPGTARHLVILTHNMFFFQEMLGFVE
ncbi:AAA family ATPase [Klebsiella pneumoniae]|uniref:AAA family ATPase n=1 Tax=Klebsiella pneumoniae TaxID=573 RepID=UPI003873AED7